MLPKVQDRIVVVVSVYVAVLLLAIVSLTLSFVDPPLSLTPSALLFVLAIWESHLTKEMPQVSSGLSMFLRIVKVIAIFLAGCFLVSSLIWMYSKF